MSGSKIIAVSGGSGSGKTTIVNRLRQQCGDEGILVLQMDHYYCDLSHLTPPERDSRNFDHPDAFDMPLLRQHLKALIAGQVIDRPTYDFATHTRTREVVKVSPSRIILIDGILSLHDTDLRQLFDVSLYVDVCDDVRLIRRLRRDMVERGRTLDSVVNQYLSSVKPMHDAYVAPQKFVANIIVSWESYNDRAIAMLSDMFKHWLKDS